MHKMNAWQIIPECYIDTCLVETLISSKLNHQKGCNNVVKLMQEKLKDQFAVGIIDKDKREVAYLAEFNLLVCKDSIYLYKHKTRCHYIVQIAPAIENFILKNVREKGIDLLQEYALPDEQKDLSKITKKIAGENEEAFDKFKKLFKNLADTTEFAKLAELIKYLGNCTYNSNVEKINMIMEG